jgi:hypothetical protein
MEKATQGWEVAWERSHQCVADVFARSEAGERSLSDLERLRSGCERKKKLVGGGVGRGSFAFWDASTCPDRARWDADAVPARLSE